MRIGNAGREQWRTKVGDWALSTWDNLIAGIQKSYHREHNEDDTHGAVTAETIEVGRFSYNSIITYTVPVGVDFNYRFTHPALATAGMVRIVPSAAGTFALYSIEAPIDEAGRVVDGRVLVIENVPTNYAVIYFIDQNSVVTVANTVPSDRIMIPGSPAGNSNLRVPYVLNPGSIVQLIYNAQLNRWVVQDQGREAIHSLVFSITTDVNNLAPTGVNSARTYFIQPTVVNCTITGWDRNANRAPTIKRVVNNGTEPVRFAHQSASSTVENRFICPHNLPFTLGVGASVEMIYLYDTNRWMLLEGESGWIPVAFNASNFNTTSGFLAGFGAANVANNRYMIKNKTLYWQIEVVNFEIVGGAANNFVILTMPAGLLCGSTFGQAGNAQLHVAGGAGWTASGIFQANLGFGTMNIVPTPAFGWPNAAGHYIFGNFQIELL